MLLIAIATIFIPLILNDIDDNEEITVRTKIPEKPVISVTNPKTLESDSGTQDGAQDEPLGDTDIEAGINEKAMQDSTLQDMPIKTDKLKDTDTGSLSAWVVQIGSFSKEENAKSLTKKLQESGYPAFVETHSKQEDIIYRVKVGPEIKLTDARKILEELSTDMQLDGVIIRHHP